MELSKANDNKCEIQVSENSRSEKVVYLNVNRYKIQFLQN